jgi:hypothetical protein
MAAPAIATQADIHGPPGSVTFGDGVVVLANGNFVVSDPNYPSPSAPIGAVYLYRPDGALISTLNGSIEHGPVGRVTALSDGNFVVASPGWTNYPNCCVGAVTWVDGTLGLTGVVSENNSLIGTSPSDEVGADIIPLQHGAYVVNSPYWRNGTARLAGAVTWVRGGGPLVGVVSSANSLVGTTDHDQVGFPGIRVLRNGNYVVKSSYWSNGAAARAGAITWVDGAVGVSGLVSPSNSLVGTAEDEQVGGIARLSNDNFLVLSPRWRNGLGAVNGNRGQFDRRLDER